MKNILRNSNFKFTKWCIALIAGLMTFATTGWAQISISAGNSASQNFNSLGTSTTATLPTNWKALKSTTARITPPAYSDAATVSAVESAGGNSLASNAGNGIYRFNANNVTSESAIGGLSSGSASKSVIVYAYYRNTGPSSISSVTISYDIEKYRNGTTSFAVELFYSANGTTWTACGPDFTTSFAADADNNGFTTAPGATTSVSSKTYTPAAAIAANGDFYLAWRYSCASGSTTSNAQALGIDNVVVSAPSASPTISGFSPSSGAVGSSVTITGSNFSSPTVKFNGAAATITASTGTSITATVPAGAMTGKITVEVAGQTTATSTTDFTVTAAGAPQVSLSPASVSGLTNFVGYASAATNYTVTGTNLGGTNLLVTASTNAIEVSTNSSTGYTNSFSLAPSVDGTLSNTVYVRISASAPVGAVSGTVSNVSGSASNNFTISGTVTQPALTLVLSPTSVQESAGAGASTGTVGIPLSLTNDLTVSLVSSNIAAATVPSTVTITNGQTNATFTIAAVANTNSYTNETAVITASQASYTSASATLTVQNVDVRVPTVVVNKFENTATDVIELLAVGNLTPGATVDMRGMLIKDHSSSNANDTGGKFVFTSAPLWQAVPAGTLIVLTLDNTATDANIDGFVVRVGLRNPTYFTPGTSTGSMDLSGTEMVMIKQAGSLEAGSVGMIHALANGPSNATQTAAAVSPKLVGDVGTAGVIYASNPNSTIADYNGSLVTQGATGTIPFGTANNPSNAAFIASLRGTKDISITIAADAAIVNENAGVQENKITVALSAVATSNLTVNLSATPAGVVNLPASVIIPAGSTTATVGFTPINDNTTAGNRTVTIGGSADTWNSANNTVTVVDVQYTNPSVVINEVVNQTSGDVVELLVIQNNLNMAGMILKDFSGDMGGDVGGSYTFTSNSLWQSVKAGTLIVLTRDATATEDTDASDGLVTVKLTNTTYFTAGGSFDISAIDMVMIKAAGAESSGITGAIHTFGNGPAGTLFKLANGAKLLFTAGGAGGGANNATSAIEDYNGTGVTAGTPTLGVANNANNQTFITALSGSVVVPPTITSTNGFSGTVGVAFSNTITATGSAPIAFSGTGLPNGLSVATNGVISGTPTAAGTNNATLTATNAAGTNNQVATFTIAKGTPSITAPPTASAITAVQALSASILTEGTASVPGTFAWTTSSTVPGSTGVYGVTFTPMDSANYNTTTVNVSVTVNPAPVGTTYNDWLQAQGVTPSDPNAAMLDYAFGATTLGALDSTLKPSVAIVPPTGGAGGDTATLVLTYYVRQNAVRLTVTPKTSADVAAAPSVWTTVIDDVAVGSPTTRSDGVTVQMRKASVPMIGDRKFLKLEVLQE